MLQETMLDLYAFYGEFNWGRKSDFCALVLLMVLAALSQVLLQREISAEKKGR